LEAIGSNSFAAVIASRFLFTTCPEEYTTELAQALEDMNLMIEEGEPSFSEKQQKQLCKLFELIKIDNKIVPQNPEDPSYFQSLWNRSLFRVTTCSNHSERLHRECNEKIITHKSVLRNLETVLKIMDAKFQVVSEEPNRQAQRQFSKLKREAEKNETPFETICPHTWCQWGKIYSARFGVSNFPCYHTARATTEIIFDPLPILTSFTNANDPIIVQMNTEWQFAERSQDLSKKRSSDLNERTSDEPVLNEDGKFLYQLTHEIVQLAYLDENRFTAVLIDLSTKWGEFCTLNGNNHDEIKRRSTFRYEMWKNINYWKENFTCI
jgi:hypothetical protein